MPLEMVSKNPEWYHIMLRVKDADLSIRFYSEYAGMGAILDQRDARGNRWVWMCFIDNPTAPLYILVEEPYWNEPEQPPSIQQLGFRLQSPLQVEEWSQRAQLAQCLVKAAQDGGHVRGYFCLVRDPDGNVLEFSYPFSPKHV